MLLEDLESFKQATADINFDQTHEDPQFKSDA